MTVAHFVWQAAYELGEATIDAQHRHLFELAEELLRARDKAALTAAAMQLYRYVRVHFAHEEAVMRQLGFPGLRAHAAMHVELIGRLNALSVKIAKGDWRQDELVSFMQDWVLVHIACDDAQLAAFIGTAGAEPVAVDSAAEAGT